MQISTELWAYGVDSVDEIQGWACGTLVSNAVFFYKGPTKRELEEQEDRERFWTSQNWLDVELTRSSLGDFASYAFLAPELRELIVSVKPDIINSHFATAYGYAAARCRRRFGDLNAAWALTVWGSDILVSPNKSPFHRRRVGYALSQAQLIVAAP